MDWKIEDERVRESIASLLLDSFEHNF